MASSKLRALTSKIRRDVGLPAAADTEGPEDGQEETLRERADYLRSEARALAGRERAARHPAPGGDGPDAGTAAPPSASPPPLPPVPARRALRASFKATGGMLVEHFKLQPPFGDEQAEAMADGIEPLIQSYARQKDDPKVTALATVVIVLGPYAVQLIMRAAMRRQPPPATVPPHEVAH